MSPPLGFGLVVVYFCGPWALVVQSAMGCHTVSPVESWCSGAPSVMGPVMGLAGAILAAGPSGSWMRPVR